MYFFFLGGRNYFIINKVDDRWESKQQPTVKLGKGVYLRTDENRPVTLVVYLMHSYVSSVSPCPVMFTGFLLSRLAGSLLVVWEAWVETNVHSHWAAVCINWSWLLPATVLAPGIHLQALLLSLVPSPTSRIFLPAWRFTFFPGQPSVSWDLSF